MSIRLRANGRNSSQRCCTNNFGSCYMRANSVCKRMQQLPTLLRQQFWELLHACLLWCANGCNNSQQCWDMQCIVGKIHPISLCKPVKLFSQQIPTFLSFRHPRSLAQQFWIRLHSSVQHCWGRARSLRMVYKDLWVVCFPRCTAGPNIVGSCCIRTQP